MKTALEILTEILTDKESYFTKSEWNEFATGLKNEIVKAMELYGEQQSKELNKLLPETFYADTQIEHRIKMMVDIWNKAVESATSLQEELEQYKELNKLHLENKSKAT